MSSPQAAEATTERRDEAECMRISRCLISFFFALLLAQTAVAQNLTFKDLKVRVTNPASTAVIGAHVTVYAEHGRLLANSSTDAQGVALLSHLPEKVTLHVEVLAPGFAPYTATVTDAHELNVRLRVGTVSETVVVSATPSPIEAGLTGMNVSTLDAAQLESMQPIAASDALRFLPGVILGDSGNRGGQTLSLIHISSTLCSLPTTSLSSLTSWPPFSSSGASRA